MAGQESGKVVAQNPPASATSVVSPNVNLLITGPSTAPSYVMPNLAGLTLASATQALGDAGVRVGTVTAVPATPGTSPIESTVTAPPPGPGSIIASQSPAPGQRIQEGATVNFEVRP